MREGWPDSTWNMTSESYLVALSWGSHGELSPVLVSAPNERHPWTSSSLPTPFLARASVLLAKATDQRVTFLEPTVNRKDLLD